MDEHGLPIVGAGVDYTRVSVCLSEQDLYLRGGGG